MVRTPLRVEAMAANEAIGTVGARIEMINRGLGPNL
jgi:hypothetical protein